jgi:putative FmdB family regulatory protein
VRGTVPTYQYACTECGHAFEQFQSFSDDALTECPECQGRLRKVFNAVGVVFKGSGFYRNDSRDKKSSTVSSESKSDSTSDSGKSSDTTSTTTPEKKSDTSSSSSPKAPASA